MLQCAVERGFDAFLISRDSSTSPNLEDIARFVLGPELFRPELFIKLRKTLSGMSINGIGAKAKTTRFAAKLKEKNIEVATLTKSGFLA